MHLRLGAPMKCAMSSYADSKRAVVICDASDWPRCTLSYAGASDWYSASSARGGWVLAALLVTTRPWAGNTKWLRMASRFHGWSRFMARSRRITTALTVAVAARSACIAALPRQRLAFTDDDGTPDVNEDSRPGGRFAG